MRERDAFRVTLRAMLAVACSGFAVPASRYFAEFTAIEIAETEVDVPGPSTVRRWTREAPRGFRFSVLGPRSIGDNGFRWDAAAEAALRACQEVAVALRAEALVLVAPAAFGAGRGDRGQLRTFATKAGRATVPLVFDVPGLASSAVTDAVESSGALATWNPLTDAPPRGAGLVYARLPGPSGHRSRYDDQHLARIAERFGALAPRPRWCVFANADRGVNAQRLTALATAGAPTREGG